MQLLAIWGFPPKWDNSAAADGRSDGHGLIAIRERACPTQRSPGACPCPRQRWNTCQPPAEQLGLRDGGQAIVLAYETGLIIPGHRARSAR